MHKIFHAQNQHDNIIRFSLSFIELCRQMITNMPDMFLQKSFINVKNHFIKMFVSHGFMQPEILYIS